MNTLALAKTAVAVLGLVFVAGADVAAAKQMPGCFTEDGFGRKRSCVQGYRARRVEQTRENCFSDDAYGAAGPAPPTSGASGENFIRNSRSSYQGVSVANRTDNWICGTRASS